MEVCAEIESQKWKALCFGDTGVDTGLKFLLCFFFLTRDAATLKWGLKSCLPRPKFMDEKEVYRGSPGSTMHITR